MGALLSVLWAYYSWLFPGNLPQVNQGAPATLPASSSSSSGPVAGNIIEGVVAKEDDLKNGEMKEVELGKGKVLLVREDDQYHAIGYKCLHAGAPLKTGVLVNGRVRCPWHGACFSTGTGDIEDFPSFDSLPCYETRVENGNVIVRADEVELTTSRRIPKLAKRNPNDNRTFVILGGGSAAHTAVETLRTHGYSGRIVLVSREKTVAYDRPKLSKAMNIDLDKVLLHKQEWYEKEAEVELMLGKVVAALDPKAKTVMLKSGETLNYDAALIATGADPQRLAFIKGADARNIYVLRDWEDSRKIWDVTEGKRIVIVGSSFIGMETAASLVRRSASVVVVGMEKAPFSRVLGDEVGKVMQKLHEDKGIQFRMEAITDEFIVAGGEVTEVKLKSGEKLPCDIVIIGAGVVPATSYLVGAEGVTLFQDKSVVVDEYMAVGPEGLYAAGDLARYPFHVLDGELVRIEHWGHSQNQAKVAALNMLAGRKKHKLTNIPVFWTAQHGKSVRYAGHALKYDEVIMDTGGQPLVETNPAFVAYYMHNGKAIAAASMNRDPVVAQFAELMQGGVLLTAQEIRDSMKLTGSTSELLSHKLKDIYNARH